MKENNRVMFTAMVGSHNYNLNNEKSDEDFKSIVTPTMEQIFDNKLANKTIPSPDKDESYIDIRTFRKELLSGSPNSIEILFSKNFEIKDNNETFQTLLTLREQIAGMNKPKLFDAYIGMARGDKYKLEKAVNENSSAKIYWDEHGYNTKALVNVIRGYSTVIRYAQNEFSNYAGTIFVEDELRTAILFAKNGGFKLKDAYAMIKGLEVEAKSFEDQYRSFEFDQGLADELTKLLHHEMLVQLNKNK